MISFMAVTGAAMSLDETQEEELWRLRGIEIELDNAKKTIRLLEAQVKEQSSLQKTVDELLVDELLTQIRDMEMAYNKVEAELYRERNLRKMNKGQVPPDRPWNEYRKDWTYKVKS